MSCNCKVCDKKISYKQKEHALGYCQSCLLDILVRRGEELPFKRVEAFSTRNNELLSVIAKGIGLLVASEARKPHVKGFRAFRRWCEELAEEANRVAKGRY